MKKIITIALLLIVCLGVFCSCSKDSNGSYEMAPSSPEESLGKDEMPGSSNSSDVTYTAPTNRKIYYTVDMSYVVADVTQGVNEVKSKMVNGEWIQSERQSNQYITVVLRIKTDRLDAFLQSLGEIGEQTNFYKQSVDITDSYVSNEQQIATLTAEKEALEKLYEQAVNMNDILTINQRLTSINSQLQYLGQTQSKYDSLVEYSVVTINLYTKNTELPQKETFWTRLVDGLGVSWNVAQALVIFAICILPFGAIAFGVVVLIIHLKKKRKAKKNPEQNPEQNQQ